MIVTNFPPDMSTTANLLYVVVGGVLGIAGSMISAYFGRGWRKEDELIGAIYEPMLRQLARVLEDIERGAKPDISEIMRLGMDSKILRTDSKVQTAARHFYGPIKLYPPMYDTAKAEADEISKKEIERYLETHTTDVPHAIHREFHLGKHDLTYRAFFGTQLAGEVTLSRCLLLGREPLSILLEECPTLAQARIDCLLAGQSCETRLCNDVVKSGLDVAGKNTAIQTVRAMRQLLIDNNRSPARPLSDLLRKHVSRIWPWQRFTQ
jgi:hypothetical protein